MTKADDTGKKLMKTGGSMIGCGCLITLLTIPALIIIIMLFF